MVDPTPDQISHRLSWIPTSLQDTYYSFADDKAIGTIADRHNVLRRDLIHVSGNYLLGFIRRRDLISELEETAEIDRVTATAILADLDREVFSEHHGAVERIYGPPVSVPDNSAIFCVGTGEARSLRCAYHITTLVGYGLHKVVPGHFRELKRFSLDEVKSRHGRHLHLVQLAWAELEVAAVEDPEDSVVFVSDTVFYDIAKVREWLLQASIDLRVPVRAVSRQGCLALFWVALG